MKNSEIFQLLYKVHYHELTPREAYLKWQDLTKDRRKDNEC